MSTTSYATTTRDGAQVELRWCTRAGSAPGSAVVYAHGGGMVAGTLVLYGPVVSRYVAGTGVPFLAVAHRLAPEYPRTTPAQDVAAGVAWLHEHARELGVDPQRIAVMGDSSGGGLAAGAALLARERGLVLAGQILIQPMLDDRNTRADPALAPFATWGYDDNHTGWRALLGDDVRGPDVPAVAAPARAVDLTGLPPAYVEVGDLDVFRDEDIDYARRLALAGVSVELHVHPGAPHDFDELAPGADVTRRARADRHRVITAL